MKTVYVLLITLVVQLFLITSNASAADIKPSQVKPSQVLLHTSAGDITLELDAKAAPKTVANFLQYVNEGFYNNTLFHRVIPDFMIQGGGFQAGMVEKHTRNPVANESSNGKQNKRGAIAMARTQHPDSATAQFFINVVDNAYLDAANGKPGYTVFGTVIKGIDVVDKIAKVSTGQRGMNGDVPVQDVLIISATQLP
jgi:cyclophilin family peptidyl-prolyl cis-trans isomerase